MSHQTFNDGRSATITWALIWIGLGTLFLLSNAGVLPDWGESWPAVLIVIGVAILIGSFFKKPKLPTDGSI